MTISSYRHMILPGPMTLEPSSVVTRVPSGVRRWLVSLPARVTTLIVAFLAVVGGRHLRRRPLPAGRPADGGLRGVRRPGNVVMQTDASSSPTRCRTIRPGSATSSRARSPGPGCTPRCSRSPRTPGPHDDPRLRRLDAGPQPGLGPGQRDGRQCRLLQRQAGADGQRLERPLPDPAHVRDPRPEPQRAGPGRARHLQHRALHETRPIRRRRSASRRRPRPAPTDGSASCPAGSPT